jgi:hypothetical protein
LVRTVVAKSGRGKFLERSETAALYESKREGKGGRETANSSKRNQNRIGYIIAHCGAGQGDWCIEFWVQSATWATGRSGDGVGMSSRTSRKAA